MRKLFALAVAATALTSPSPAPADAPCQVVSEAQISDLFTRWNDSLATLNPWEVVKNYAESAFFLTTYSDKPRLTQQERFEYYTDILKRHPQLKVDQRSIHIGCNMANDTGLYTIIFKGTEKVPGRYSITYQFIDGQWLIVAQHTSLMPEKH